MSERVTQVIAEVLRTGGTANERVTQVCAEVLRTGGTANERVTQLCVEVLRETANDAITNRTVVCVCT